LRLVVGAALDVPRKISSIWPRSCDPFRFFFVFSNPAISLATICDVSARRNGRLRSAGRAEDTLRAPCPTTLALKRALVGADSIACQE
jgi:hypothetical protein